MTKPDFSTITGRFLGRTREQWEAEKKKTGLTDQQLCDLLGMEAVSKARDQRNIRFFRSGRIGTPEQYSNS